MPDPTAVHSTFTLERSFPVPPEHVFAAFADPAQKRRWYAEGRNHDVQHFETDVRPGGRELFRILFTGESPVAGLTCTNDSSFLDIVPGRRLVFISTMSFGEHPFSASLCTFEFLPTPEGTDLLFTHQGAFFENSDGPAMREEGWRKLLDRLTAQLTA